MVIKIQSDIQHYRYDSMAEAIKGLAKWVDKDLVDEVDLAVFVIQMHNQIPEGIWNDAQNRL